MFSRRQSVKRQHEIDLVAKTARKTEIERVMARATKFPGWLLDENFELAEEIARIQEILKDYDNVSP